MRRTTKVSLGLLATWAVSDLEELVTMSRHSREVAARLPESLPLPDRIRREGISQRHVAAAIGLVGVVMATAAASGVRSGGRSAMFRATLLGFGLHGFGHLAGGVVTRGYAPGLATAPTMVIPYWLWARRQLAAEGIPDVDRTTVAVALTGPALALGVHALVHRLLGE